MLTKRQELPSQTIQQNPAFVLILADSSGDRTKVKSVLDFFTEMETNWVGESIN